MKERKKELLELLAKYPKLPIQFCVNSECFLEENTSAYIDCFKAEKTHIYILDDQVYDFEDAYEQLASIYSDDDVADEDYEDYINDKVNELENYECILINVYP